MTCPDPSRGVYLTYLVQGLILLSAASSITAGKYVLALIAGFAFLLALAPSAALRNTPLCLPWEVNLLVAVSLYLHIMGHIGDYYVLFAPYYDKLTHLVSSVTVALLSTVLAAFAEHRGLARLTKPALIVFVLTFTLAAGAAWEIYEFVIDQILGTSLQLGNTDTMVDLIMDLIGATIVAAVIAIVPESVQKLQLIRGIVGMPANPEPGSIASGPVDPADGR